MSERIQRGTAYDQQLTATLNAAFVKHAVECHDELIKALEPFGDVDGEGAEDYPDETKVTVTFGRTTAYSLTLGDFRRARAAIAKATGAP